MWQKEKNADKHESGLFTCLQEVQYLKDASFNSYENDQKWTCRMSKMSKSQVLQTRQDVASRGTYLCQASHERKFNPDAQKPSFGKYSTRYKI